MKELSQIPPNPTFSLGVSKKVLLCVGQRRAQSESLDAWTRRQEEPLSCAAWESIALLLG